MEKTIQSVIDLLKDNLNRIQPEFLWGGAAFLAVLFLLLLVLILKRKKSKIPVSPQKDVDSEEAIAVPSVKEPTTQKKPAVKEVPETAEGLANRLKSGLSKTRKSISQGLERILSKGKSLDEESLEDIEELLITSDIGVRTTQTVKDHIEKKAAGIKDPEALKQIVKDELLAIITEREVMPKKGIMNAPHVIMVVGVNGVGKTTTIGKMAAGFTAEGKKVLIAAADTFRAAAVEQLSIWAERAGADIIKHRENADPAAVAYDSVEAAVARKADVVLVDTAGRLHTKVNLMEELKKVKRTIAKKMPGAPHEVLLVIDATTGQNALTQAEQFNEALDLTGMALTKLDGTAKGGIVIGICSALNIPLDYIGVGEGIEDLQTFDPVKFVNALFS